MNGTRIASVRGLLAFAFGVVIVIAATADLYDIRLLAIAVAVLAVAAYIALDGYARERKTDRPQP